MIPKFRVWDKEINYLDYDVRVTSTDKYEKVEVLDCFSDWREIEENNYVIMRNTGLRDKKGNYIYEGDICASYNGFETEYNKIEWSDKDCTWMIEGDFTVDYLRDFLRHSSLEVIGNIYENPEKLEEDEE